MGNETIEIKVTSIKRLSDNVTLYDATYLEGNGADISLDDYTDKFVDPGYFPSLEIVAEAIEGLIKEGLEESIGKNKDDIRVHFMSEVNLHSPYNNSPAFIGSEGAFIHRPLNDSELEKITRLVDSKLRPILYE